MEVERATGQNLQFLTPFVGCTLVLLAPTYILWKARSDVDAAEAAADQDEEEEVEVSLSQELRRMKSVINKPVLAAVLATVVTSIGQDARDPILGPHLSSRCEDEDVLQDEHFPFDYSALQIALVFSSQAICFLPLSAYVGSQADARGRDFAWMRRVMALGLGLEAVAFLLMGPTSLLPANMMRQLETDSAIVLSQMVLGMSNALTLIVAFPFIEGACELTAKCKLTQRQRINVAGTVYNFAFSGGCALGPLLTGLMSDYIKFSECLLILAVMSILAMVYVCYEGVTSKDGKVGGFWDNPQKHLDLDAWKKIGDKFQAAEDANNEPSSPMMMGNANSDGGGLSLKESAVLMNTIEKEFAELSSFRTKRMGRAFARARPNKTLSAPITRSRGNSDAGSSRRYSPGYSSPGTRSRTSRSGSNDSTTNSVAAGIASATPPRTDQDGDAIDRATISSDSLYNASPPHLSPADRKSNGAGVQASIYDTPLNEQVLEFNGEDGEEEEEEEQE